MKYKKNDMWNVIKKRELFTKWKWFGSEFIKMYSSERSFFSKKRFESGVAFFISQFGMIFFLIKKIDSMDMYEMGIWSSLEFLIAGYTVNQIQKEKNVKTTEVLENPEEDTPNEKEVING